MPALKQISELTDQQKYVEHVSNHIYEHSPLFKRKFLQVTDTAEGFTDIRLTMDTAPVYEMLTSF